MEHKPPYFLLFQHYFLNNQQKCLEFKHPITKKEMKLEAPLPEYFEKIIKELDKN